MNRTNQNIIYSDVTEQTARFAKALAHPVRLAILKHLSSQNCCYNGDLLEIIPMAQSTISQHLKELKNAGLIIGEIETPKVRYCINQANWQRAKTLFVKLFNEDFSSISCC
jgi:DNA-binding transcriptional ArsR family regulator